MNLNESEIIENPFKNELGFSNFKGFSKKDL